MHKLHEFLPEKLQNELCDFQVSKDAHAFYDGNHEKVKNMFGYPAYGVKLSLLTQYLLLLHYTSPFSNNCGDIDERGNYDMDTKDVEKKIVNLFSQKFGMGETPWGYVTSGGSESNSCGISLALNEYPNGIIYYSQSAHYSVEKYARNYKHVEIPTVGCDKINLEMLFNAISQNFFKYGAPAILILTHGTTKYGVCDDVDAIVSYLKRHSIPYYIHLDAALYGGIPNNQSGAPLILNAKERGINSVCVSMHKYLGFPDVHSVFVATKKPECKQIAYIGQHDTTVSGSRSIPAFALYNHILEQLNTQESDTYNKNIVYFEGLLQDAKIKYYREPLSNIFVFNSPSEAVCKQFQLSCFIEQENDLNVEKAHVIIFPHHEKAEMQRLVNAIKG